MSLCDDYCITLYTDQSFYILCKRDNKLLISTNTKKSYIRDVRLHSSTGSQIN